jgi:hypothetical protein
MTNEEIKSKWLGFIEASEKGIARSMAHIRDRVSFIQVTSGRSIRVDPESSCAPVLKKLKDMRSTWVNPENMLEKMDELDSVTSPLFEFLHGLDKKVTALADESFKSYVSKGKGTKSFSENTNSVAKTEAVHKKEESGKMGKIKMFKQGVWSEVEVDQEDEAALASQMQAETGLSYGECLLKASLAAKDKLREPGVEPGKHVSERVPNPPDSVAHTSERVIAADGVPQEAVDLLRESKGGVVIRLSNGQSYMKVGQRVLPVSYEGQEDILKFSKNPSLLEGKRFEAAPIVKKSGFSSDGKTFTRKDGRTIPVMQGTAADNEEVTAYAFEVKFKGDLKAVRSGDVAVVVRKAIQLLRNAGLDPVGAGLADVRAAINTAARSTDEEFDKASRYTSQVAEFGSFEKALLAAS